MRKLLQLSVCGIKNIEKLITIDFSNLTIEKGTQKANNVKGIFGFNGAGKSAIIMAVDLYNKIVCTQNHLMQNDVKNNLDKIVNYVTQEFFISTVFEYEKDVVLKHILKISKDKVMKDFIISEEKVSISTGRTMNEKYDDIVVKDDKGIYCNMIENNVSIHYQELKYNSILPRLLQEIVSKHNENKNKTLSNMENAIVSLYLSIDNIKVLMQESDKHRNYNIDNTFLDNILKTVEAIKAKNSLTNYNVNDTIIKREDYTKFEKDNKKLEIFIKYFKPDLKYIKLKKDENREYYHVRKVFVYENYDVEFEFESSGIKQLVSLFSYLDECANGKIVFIDEIDTNINSVYFTKLISFFKNFGNGQLIFTTHNIEAMNALRQQSRSIVVLGENNNLDTWVAKGNKSPITDYVNGLFPNSPMNIEDFDFINIFLGEK